MGIRPPILPLHSPHPSIPLHIAIPRFISSSLLSSSSSTTTSILSKMLSSQSQNGPQVGVPFLGLCLKLANFGDAFKVPFVPCSTPSSSPNEDLIIAYLELSVRFEELCEEFNHLIECHWVPLQRFSQGVLSSLSVLAAAPISEGAFCAGCGGRIVSPIPSVRDGQRDSSSVPIIPRVQSSKSLPKLESSPHPSPPSEFLDFRSQTWERLEEGARQLSEEEFQALFSRAEGDSSESSTVATDGSGAILFAIAEGVRVILAQEAMEKSIRSHWVELEHDVLGCPLCYVDPATGEVTFCRRSPFHPAHPFHHCSPFSRKCC